jgi:hypothetical protein
MAFSQKLFTSLQNYNNPDTRIGELNRIWYDSVNNVFRIQLDKTTPGGTIIGGGGTGGGNYTLPTASTTVKGGVKIDGTTITINNQVISGFSGSYTDLTNTPTIPTTVTVNGTSITLNSSGTITAAAGTLTGTTLNSTVVTSSLTSVGTLGSLTVQGGSGTYYAARFKGSTGGDQFSIGLSSTAGYGAGNDVLNSAGTAYAPYTISASTMTFKTGSSVPATSFSIDSSGNVTFNNTVSGSISGNAATATKLATARTINGVSFDGSANITIKPRVSTPAVAGTYAIDTDSFDMVVITGQNVNITDVTTTGTPTNGQKLWFSVTGTAARTISFNATNFEASTVALPTTTVTTNRLDVGFVWNAVTSKWRCVAQA